LIKPACPSQAARFDSIFQALIVHQLVDLLFGLRYGSPYCAIIETLAETVLCTFH
jgi:hypothetical protein